MNQPISFQGRSLLFNVLFVLLNLIGLTFLVVGFHENFKENSTLFISIGVLLMVTTIIALILFHGRVMMSAVSRVLVGGLCIVSGLVKANDPIGFSYKLAEYFEDGALAYRIKEWFGLPSFSLEFLIDFALPLSVLICIIEIVLGVMLIIGGKLKIVAYLTLFMMLFFTFLTWHTANCDADTKFVDRDTYPMSDHMAMLKIEEAKTNKEVKIFSKTSEVLIVDELKSPQCVDDCGCFGDAMKGSVGRSLTPKESLWKDLILVYLVLWIFMSQWVIQPNTTKQNLIFSISSIVLVSFFSWVFGWSFPILFSIMVLLGALWIVRAGGKIAGNYGGSVFIVTLITGFFITYVLMYEPLKDYRPYAVGNNLIQKMNDGIEGKYESVLVYKNSKTGKTKEYSSTSKEYINSKIWEDENWVYKSMIQKAIVETKLPSISDFEPFININEIGKEELELQYVQDALKDAKVKGLKILDIAYNSNMEVPLDEYNLTDYPTGSYKIVDTIELSNPSMSDINIKDLVLKSKTIMVVSSKSLNKANFENINRLKEIQKGCLKNNIPFIFICNASRSEIKLFRNKHNFKVPIFVNDEKTIQAISRSNPTLLVIQKAVVKGKYPNRALPNFESLTTKILNKK